MIWRLACIVALVATPLRAGYPDGVPGAEIGRIVRAAMESAGVTGDLDDPIRAFPACDSRPTAKPRAGDWATVEVICPAPRWSRAIRTGAQTDAQDAEPSAPAAPAAVILNRSLPKGAIVTDADLTMAQIAGLSPDQTFRSINDVAGRRLKSALGAGKPVLQRHVEPLWLVEIGAPVVLIASAGGLEVSAPAEAIEPGGMGDLVRVLNLASGREVKAVVTGPNRVTAQTNIR